MDEKIKNNIFYRPELGIERNYYSEGRFEKETPRMLQEEVETPSTAEEIAKRNRETTELLLSIHDVIPFVPEQLRKTIDNIVTEIIFVINEPEFNAGPEKSMPDTKADEPTESLEPTSDIEYPYVSVPQGEYVVDEDGFVWGEPDGSGISVEVAEIRPNDELAREQYNNDISLIMEDYAKNMTHVLQKYLCNLSIAMNETGIDKVDYLNFDYEGESVSGITVNLHHLSDTIARNQLMIDELSRLFSKTHSEQNVENIIAALDTIAQERIRYYKEEYDIEIQSPLDITNREILRKCRADYDNKYFQAKLDLYKFLDSGTKITDDILGKANDLQHAKADLLLQGVNVFTHKKYESVQVSNALSADYSAAALSSGSATPGGAAKAASIIGRAPSSDTNPDYKSLHASGGNVVDKMRSLQGKISYVASDGTNCMRTIGIAYEGTDLYGQINCDTALSVAKQSNQFVVCDADGYAADGKKYNINQAGTIAMVNGGSHAVMVTEKGGVIQNGQSRNGVYESGLSVDGMFGGAKNYIVYVGSGGAGK